MYVDFVTWNICLSWIWGAYHDALFYSLHVWLSFCLFYSWLCLCEWMCVCVFVCSFGCLRWIHNRKKTTFYISVNLFLHFLVCCYVAFGLQFENTHTHTYFSIHKQTNKMYVHLPQKHTIFADFQCTQHTTHIPMYTYKRSVFFLLSSFIHTIKCRNRFLFEAKKYSIHKWSSHLSLGLISKTTQRNEKRYHTLIHINTVARQNELSKRDIWTNARFTNGLQTARIIKNCLYRVFD